MRRLRSARVFPALLFIISAGCSIEKPQAPSFRTDVNVPTGTYRYTVAQLIRSRDVIQGDTTGHHPVRISWRGDVQRVDVGDRLSARAPATNFSARLGDLTLPSTPAYAHDFLLNDVSPTHIPLGNVVILPFSFNQTEAVPPLSGFTQGVLRSGTLTFRLANNLPIDLQNLRAQIYYSGSSDTLVFNFGNTIHPGGADSVSVPLTGTLYNSGLNMRIAGHSPGSAGFVNVTGSESISIEAAFKDLVFESVTAPIGATSFSARDSVSLGANIQVTDASVRAGSLPITLVNSIPLDVTVEIRLPELMEGGHEWTRSYPIAAGGAITRTESLANTHLVPAAGAGGERLLHYVLQIHTDGSSSPVNLTNTMGASAQVGTFQLQFQSVTAVFMQDTTRVQEVRTNFTLPVGADSLTFHNADLSLTVQNGIQVSGTLNLTIKAIKNLQETQVHLPPKTIQPAVTPGQPVTTIVSWDEIDGILPLVNLHPEQLAVSGFVMVGDGVTSSTVNMTDSISATYEMDAPLRVTIRPTTVRPDSFTFNVNKDLQDRIREDINEGEATMTIVNHLPIGASVELWFAVAPESLRNHPRIRLTPVSVASGTIDPSSGEVTAASTGEAHIALLESQIPFFARDKVYGQAVITFRSGGSGAVQFMTDDYLEVSGLLRMRMKVHK